MKGVKKPGKFKRRNNRIKFKWNKKIGEQEKKRGEQRVYAKLTESLNTH